MAKKGKLIKDIVELAVKAKGQMITLGVADIFVLGYMAAKLNLDKLIDNDAEITNAYKEYDKTNDLELPHSAKEALLNLGVIPGRIPKTAKEEKEVIDNGGIK